MLDAVKADLVQAATAQLLTGKLASYTSVRGTDDAVASQDQPALTIDWDGQLSVTQTGSGVDIQGTFSLATYVSAQGSDATADADRQIENCLFRWDATTSRWVGLLAWLAGLTGYVDDYGRPWLVRVQPEIRRGAGKSGSGFSQAAVVLVDISTIANKSEFT